MQQVRARARLGLLDQLVMVHTAPDAVVSDRQRFAGLDPVVILVEGVVRAGDDIVLHKQRMPGEVAGPDDPAIEYRVRLPLAVNQHLWSACATPACRYDGSL